MLLQRNGGASFSFYFPDSEKISWRNEELSLHEEKWRGDSQK